MDSEKIGKLIRNLRINAHMTQKELGEKLHLSDKTISKWENGGGIPSVDILPSLSKALGVSVDAILSGEKNISSYGMKMSRPKFYICPVCGNVIVSAGSSEVFCHGISLSALKAKKAEGEDLLTVENSDGELLLTTSHEMTKDHYISFCAFVSYDRISVVSCYPQWHLNVRFPISRGSIYYYCTKHGLYEQKVR